MLKISATSGTGSAYDELPVNHEGNDLIIAFNNRYLIDSLRACGMPNGEYTLGGQKFIMKDGLATLEDGTIAGSATCLAEGFRRAVRFGVPLETALRAATINPAKAAGLWDELGSVTSGKRADLLGLNDALMPEAIFIGGVRQ